MWGHHLHHGIANWEGTQKNREEKESHVKVPGRGNSKESARRLVEEVDRESTAVEEKEALEKTDARKEGTEQNAKPHECMCVWGGVVATVN